MTGFIQKIIAFFAAIAAFFSGLFGISIRDPNTNRFLRQFFRSYCVKPLVNPTASKEKTAKSAKKSLFKAI